MPWMIEAELVAPGRFTPDIIKRKFKADYDGYVGFTGAFNSNRFNITTTSSIGGCRNGGIASMYSLLDKVVKAHPKRRLSAIDGSCDVFTAEYRERTYVKGKPMPWEKKEWWKDIKKFLPKSATPFMSPYLLRLAIKGNATEIDYIVSAIQTGAKKGLFIPDDIATAWSLPAGPNMIAYGAFSIDAMRGNSKTYSNYEATRMPNYGTVFPPSLALRR